MHEKYLTISSIREDRKSTRLNSSHANIYILSLHDALPIYMAVACGTPILGIYGPTNPSLGGPVSPDATVLRSGIWCSPCYNAKDTTADCRYNTTQCMKNILPSQVFEKIGRAHV